ncbi:hypothetical protein EI546_01980 [Aequorivita sp. H23M31]|uniref:Tetratricopeptide repeat protein n=1 Tax=Aequorivita ciconiae TaxID=2494375 RepID=A0A410G003_9FLAO|nr:hypothetical protein [Aequorivita sp. H23M31]QAA80573.1 hypothetical protein EI546_01980 [Aequorivita sp. H23M31]
MQFKSFINECHKKEVFKLLSFYIVSSWVLLQVLAVTWEALGLPHTSVTYLIIFLLAGFPVFIFLVWKFRIAPLKKNEDVEEQEKLTKEFHKIYFSAIGVIGIICATAIFLIVGNTFSKNSVLPSAIHTDKIAVLKFGNNTGDPKYDIVGKMASDWVIHGITENQLGQVISEDVISQYNDMLRSGKSGEDQENMVRKYLKPARIISGNFYLNNGQLIFQSSITDGETNSTIISFKKNTCNSANALDCIKDLSESITGYLATSANKKLLLQERPPKYEAYKYLLDAKSTGSDEEQLALLNSALEIDPTYFEAKVLRVAYFYNQREFKKADSLLKLIKPDSHRNLRQLNLLNMYEATLKGDNRKAYEMLLREYKMAPFDLITNKTAMVLALQFVNRPQDVEEIFNVIKSDSVDFVNCSNCVERIYVKALADVQLNNYQKAINESQKVLAQIDSDILKKPLLQAWVRTGSVADLNNFLFQQELTATPENLLLLYMTAGKEYLLKGNNTTAEIYFKKAKNLGSQISDKHYLAEALFYLGDFARAEEVYHKLHIESPKSIDFLGKLAISNYMLGNNSEAEKNLHMLKNLRGPFQFGEVDYVLAQYDAMANKEDEMYLNLLKSVAEGHLFISTSFQNDPLFRKYINSDRFQKILKFWY